MVQFQTSRLIALAGVHDRSDRDKAENNDPPNSLGISPPGSSNVDGIRREFEFTLVGDQAPYSAKDAKCPPLLPVVRAVSIFHNLIADLTITREVKE